MKKLNGQIVPYKNGGVFVEDAGKKRGRVALAMDSKDNRIGPAILYDNPKWQDASYVEIANDYINSVYCKSGFLHKNILGRILK